MLWSGKEGGDFDLLCDDTPTAQQLEHDEFDDLKPIISMRSS